MLNGFVDIDSSRRGYNIECEYWLVSKDEMSIDKSTLIQEKTPEGEFYAKLAGNIDDSNNVVANAFMYKKTSAVLETRDYINIKPQAIVKIEQGILAGVWRVDDAQSVPIRTLNEFDNCPPMRTTIYIRR